MGYPIVNNFDKNFIERTIENLEKDVPNTYTQLLNSLLGLIVLPRQWNRQGRRATEYFNIPLDECEELRFLANTTYYTNDENVNIEIKKLEYKGHIDEVVTLKKTIDRLRHVIAHQGLRPTKDGTRWEGVIFRSYYNDDQTSEWNDDYNLQMYLTQEELKTFTLFVANKYLEEINNA